MTPSDSSNTYVAPVTLGSEAEGEGGHPTGSPGSVTQHKFLTSAMDELGMTAEEFAKRIGCAWDTFRKWLSDPSKPSNFREMPGVAWALVREVLEHERLKRAQGALNKSSAH